MGRRKIAIEPLTDDRNRTVTFVKRKAGLFKKAHELAVLCQVDLAVIIVGNNNKIYEFSSVDTPELIKSYQRCDIHEQKLPENYGNYKKKARVHERPIFLPKDELHDVPVDDADSDYDSESPEPKRHKPSVPSRQSTPSSMYNSKSLVGSRIPQFSEPQKEKLLQRPVLRVQIPSDAKNSSSNDSAKTITALETTDKKQGIDDQDGQLVGRSDGYSKLKGIPTKTPQLPVPTISKSQTLSPSSAMAPQLPRNAGVPFFHSMPQASPGGYQPAILPTPVLNQVFNQQYMGQSGSGNNENNGTEEGHHDNDDSQKYKPSFPPQFANPEQTPMLALPSRYVNDIFPSPSNLYPLQEWPLGMTSFPQNMPHYFVGMVPLGSGTTPMTGNPMFVNARGSLLLAVGGTGNGHGNGNGNGNGNGSGSGQRGFHAPPDENLSGQNNQNRPQQQLLSTSNTLPQNLELYMSGQFFKKD